MLPCHEEMLPCHKEMLPCHKETLPWRWERLPCSREVSPGLRLQQPRHPHHLLEGGDPFRELAQGGLAEGAHAVLGGLALDLGGVGAVDDEGLDGVVDRHDLEDAGAAEVAGVAALEAPLP